MENDLISRSAAIELFKKLLPQLRCKDGGSNMIWWRSFLLGVAIGMAFVMAIAWIAAKLDKKETKRHGRQDQRDH